MPTRRTREPHAPLDPAEGRLLVGCFRGMGDLLYLSASLEQLRQELPTGLRLELATGRGLWAEAARHHPAVDRIHAVDSWDEIRRLGREGGFRRYWLSRISEWMPWRRYRGWVLRARIERLHLIDIHARLAGVRLDPRNRRPVYYFSDSDPDDDPRPARAAGPYVLAALHGFTNGPETAAAAARLLPPLFDLAVREGRRLVLVGPPDPLSAPAGVIDLRGAPIRRVATWVREARLVISGVNGIAVLADALDRRLILVAVGRDPLSVVGPIQVAPAGVYPRIGREGEKSTDLPQILEGVREALTPEEVR